MSKISIISNLPYYNNSDQLAIPTSKISDSEYVERMLELCTQGYGTDHAPSSIVPAIWHRGENLPYLSEPHLQKFLQKNKNLKWWFSVMSDCTGFSVDYFYPKNPIDGQSINVYGVTDFDRIYKHKWIHGVEGLASIIVETSLKHWAYSVII